METYKKFIQNILDTRGRFACGEVYHERHHIIPNTKDGLLINKFFNAPDASYKTGIKRSAIANCLCGLSKTAGGYIWRKEDNPLTQADIIIANVDKRKCK